MARLTRQESQERTRRLLVEAAEKLFLRDGFRATSLDAIGDEAGFSRGAVYSNFASKTEIGMAVVDGLYERSLTAAIESVSAVADQEPHVWVTALSDSMQASIGDPQWARLENELAVLSTEGQMRAAMATRYANLRKSCAQLVVANAAARGVELAVDADLIGLATLSAVLGLGIQRACDPALSGDLIAPVLSLLVSAGFEQR